MTTKCGWEVIVEEDIHPMEQRTTYCFGKL